jgi:sulfate transport system substrate-binding protein
MKTPASLRSKPVLDRLILVAVLWWSTAYVAQAAASATALGKTELLNASYDVSRELFAQINPAFQAQWQAQNGHAIEIRQSHGGSSKQARAVADGLQADVVTFNQATDIQFLVKSGLVQPDWSARLPNGASPFYSFPVLLVRAGNPKHITDWSDLAKPDVKVIFPNPKTSGNGRYTYLAAYAYALNKEGKDEANARAFMGKALANVPVFDTGGRGATTTFVERQLGDVLVTFESEISTIRHEYAKAQLQVVYPSLSLQADFPVAVVDGVVKRHGTRAAAEAYLRYLYSEAGQEIIARNFNRVRNEAVLARHKAEFPAIRLTTVEAAFGGWDQVSKVHFADGGVLDQLLGDRR